MSNEVTSAALNKNFVMKLSVNILVTLIGCAFFFASFDVARGFQQVIGADQYSRFISVLLMVLGVLGIGRSILDNRKGLFEGDDLKIFVDMRRAGFRISMMFSLLILNVFLIRRIGYFESGFIFMVLAIFFLGERTPRRFGTSVLFSAGITAIIYLVFGVILNIYLPRGLFIN